MLRAFVSSSSNIGSTALRLTCSAARRVSTSSARSSQAIPAQQQQQQQQHLRTPLPLPTAAEATTGNSRRMATWAGTGSQQDFMHQDECIVVSEHDEITGSTNKHDCHRFESPRQPRGLLHRAFSVFLFDGEGRLLLQQRAKHKITFPSVWTNSCCSHPLMGQQPDEVDQPEQILDGSVPGIRNAAVRKLQHELGIPSHQLPLSSFRFLTRLHYCAADTDTWGPDAEWGEHEIDYVLFIRAHGVTLEPNPEEVDAVRYVTQQELAQMMAPSGGLRWSPWFKIIAERFLPTWWADLDAVLKEDKHADRGTIHHVLG